MGGGEREEEEVGTKKENNKGATYSHLQYKSSQAKQSSDPLPPRTYPEIEATNYTAARRRLARQHRR